MTEPEVPKSSTAATSDEPASEAEVDLPFEVALARLEQVVDRLEQGELELEASLVAFEEGVRLSKHCAGQLAAAESRIEILTREGEGWITRSFEDADDEGEREESE
jgi:exodeoxyribonuclease VII small subunit